MARAMERSPAVSASRASAAPMFDRHGSSCTRSPSAWNSRAAVPSVAAAPPMNGDSAGASAAGGRSARNPAASASACATRIVFQA